MGRVVGDVHHFRNVLFSNVFLLDGGRGDRWLVDCGHWSERLSLLLALKKRGLAPRDLTGVLLTHLHSDHAGNARFLQRHGARIVAHRRDAETLATTARERMRRGAGSFAAGLLAEFENYLPAVVEVDQAVDEGDVIAGLEVHHVPGHTDGSVFYRHEPLRALLTGDSLLTAIPPLVHRSGFALPYPTFSVDIAEAERSVRAFHGRGFTYEHLLPGHGRPLVGAARSKVLEFLETGARKIPR